MMMSPKTRPAAVLALAWLALASCPLSLRALDFTLRQTHVRSEGLVATANYITDGDSKIMLRIPPDWQANGAPNALELVPKQASSHVVLSQIPAVPALPMDAAGQTTLQQRTRTQLPGDAKKVEALPPVEASVPINHWTSLDCAYRYEFYGQTMRSSVLYVNMAPGKVVQLKVTAPDAAFDEVHEQARAMLSGWFEPSKDLPPELVREYETDAAGKPLPLPNSDPLGKPKS